MTQSTTAIVSGAAVVQRPRRLRALWAAVLVVVLAILIATSVALGSREVDLADILAALGGSTEGFDRASIAMRIPRTLLAVVAGAALAVCGAVLQGVTRNPLADPRILGINSGASLAVVVGIAWFGLATSTGFIWTAIAGSALSAAFVYAIGSIGRDGPTPLKLTLAGAATTIALTSFVSAIVLPRADISENVTSWMVGGVGGATFERVWQVLPFVIVGFVICFLSAKSLNTLALGDELAAGLGTRVALARGTAAIGAIVLCGAVTAVAGPIGFVGLVIPHICRLLAGPDHRWLLPLSALAGAGLLTASDIVGRIVLRPAEIDVGIITALIGAPFFIAIVRRQKVRAL